MADESAAAAPVGASMISSIDPMEDQVVDDQMAAEMAAAAAAGFDAPHVPADNGDGAADTVAVVQVDEKNEQVHAIMAQALPRIAIIQSAYNKRYLHYINSNSGAPKFLQFAGPYSFGLETRFELEPSKATAGLFHIRSLSNQKYWSTQGPSDNWIASRAEKPEEDRYKWSCTLFQPVFLTAGDNKTIRLRHVKTGHYACLWRVGAPRNECLYAATSGIDQSRCDVMTIIDWNAVVVLPDRIAFKGDNDRYLQAWTDGFMSFDSGITDPNVDFEVHPAHSGGIHLKSVTKGKYWSDLGSSVWVHANVANTSDLQWSNTIFVPVKLNEDVIALRSFTNNLYCRRFTASSKRDCLATVTTYIDGPTHLKVEEPVISRKIDNIRYRLTDARIYDETILVLINKEATNITSQPNEMTLDLTYTDTRTSTWTASVSLTLGVKTTMSAGVPLVAEGSIEYSAEFNSSYQWGETVERSLAVGSNYRVIVPPRSRVKASLMATQGSCDIPFSYKQTDLLRNGTTKIYDKDDGLFKGQNSFNYRYMTEEFELSADE